MYPACIWNVSRMSPSYQIHLYIVRRFTTGNPSDEPPWLPNKEMTKLCEVSDETSTDRFPHFQCLTLQCDTSTLNLRLGGRLGFWSDLEVDLGAISGCI
jgi:hypothetical protein